MLKRLLIALGVSVLSLACTQAPVDSTPTPAAPVPTVAPSGPYAPGVSPETAKLTPTRHPLPPVTIVPNASHSPSIVAYDDNAVPDCSDATRTWGSGKENYCVIKAKFITKFGVAPHGKIWYYAKLKEMQGLMADEANGLPKLMHEYGCDPKGWGPRVSSPSFGPFTGAQHEFGGNEFLAAAMLVDGLTRADQAHWLLYGNYDRVKSYPCNGVDLKK